MDAFEDALGKCSNHHAPWYCVPSNRKWYRNWVISDTIVRAMKLVKPRYPTVVFDPKKIVVE
jgi:polyphosphate kinase 2 (PPK2 family)